MEFKKVKLSPDMMNILNYEPINIVHKICDEIVTDIAKQADETILKACMAVNVDPDALIMCMKKIRALEAEVRMLTPLIEIGQVVFAKNNYSGNIDEYSVISVHHYEEGDSQFSAKKYCGKNKEGGDTYEISTWCFNQIDRDVFKERWKAEESLEE